MERERDRDRERDLVRGQGLVSQKGCKHNESSLRLRLWHHVTCVSYCRQCERVVLGYITSYLLLNQPRSPRRDNGSLEAGSPGSSSSDGYDSVHISAVDEDMKAALSEETLIHRQDTGLYVAVVVLYDVAAVSPSVG